MGDRRLLGLAAGTAAAVLLVGGIGTTAYAADVRSTVETALAALGVEASDELVDDLAGEEMLDDALDEGGDEGGAERDEPEGNETGGGSEEGGGELGVGRGQPHGNLQPPGWRWMVHSKDPLLKS